MERAEQVTSQLLDRDEQYSETRLLRSKTAVREPRRSKWRQFTLCFGRKKMTTSFALPRSTDPDRIDATHVFTRERCRHLVEFLQRTGAAPPWYKRQAEEHLQCLCQ